jgi:SAM-dependent methyltransferase
MKAVRKLAYRMKRGAAKVANRVMGGRSAAAERWEPILTRIPPLEEYEAVGHPENYYIHPGYHPRADNEFFDDTPLTDEWQKEVYQFAREIADLHGLRRILDVGCGSGYKLVKYFGDFDTIGVDLAPTVAFLRKKYPTRRWEICDFKSLPDFLPDLILCADLIEHLKDPGELIRYLKSFPDAHLVISTPERNLLLQGTHNGPPRNRAHVREWSMAEFRAFMQSEFLVLCHFISNRSQATQCVWAVRKDRLDFNPGVRG